MGIGVTARAFLDGRPSADRFLGPRYDSSGQLSFARLAQAAVYADVSGASG
jgi:hypothetical protein